jgi:hypothetical protein
VVDQDLPALSARQFALAEDRLSIPCAFAQETSPRASLAPERRATSRPCMTNMSVGMLRMP